MKINKTIVKGLNQVGIVSVVLIGLLIGGLSAGILLSERPLMVNAAPDIQQVTPDTDDDDEPEQDENISLGQAGLTTDQAIAIAEAEFSGAKALTVAAEKEHGTIIYEIKMDNGLEVEIDANNGDILEVEQDER